MDFDHFALLDAEDVILKESWFDKEKFFNMKREVFVHMTKFIITQYKRPSMTSFSMTFTKPEEYPEEISKLINFAVERNLQSLDLDFADVPPWKELSNSDYRAISPQFELPMQVYSHGIFLKRLTLSLCNFSVPGFIRFTKLKFLNLSFMNLDISTIQAVLRNCQSLQELVLKRCRLESLDTVSLPQVESLSVEKCKLVHPRFHIVAPKLRVLSYIGHVLSFNLTIDENVMEEAHLDFNVESEFNAEKGIVVAKILRQLSSAKVLNLKSYAFQVLPFSEDPLRLPNALGVQKLTLHTSLHTNKLCGIGFILNRCPRLIILKIIIDQAKINDHDHNPPIPFEGLDAYACITTTLNLKKVVVYGFTGRKQEVYMLKHILKHGSMMKKLTIWVTEKGISSKYGRKEIWDSVEKASQDVELAFKTVASMGPSEPQV